LEPSHEERLHGGLRTGRSEQLSFTTGCDFRRLPEV
jgi:hypothetical protein